MHDLPPQGSLEEVFPPRLVAGLHVREFEGILRLTLPDAIRVLYFKKGEIASAASNAEPDRLANILMREGRLTAEQLDLARARLQAGSSVGKALIEMGFLTPSELLQGARQQVRVIVASCFGATSGTYEMVPGPLPAEVTSLGINTRRLLFDCLVEASDRAAIVREVGSMEAIYRPTGQLNFVLASLKLDFETDRIGRLLNGEASLSDISGRTSHDDFMVSKVVLALDLLGAAESVAPAEEEAPAAGRGRLIPIVSESPIERDGAAAEEYVVEITGDEDADDGRGTQAPAAIAAAVEEAIPAVGAPAAVAVTEMIDTTPAPAGPAEPAGGEPPPIPQNELPAFAQAADDPQPAAAGDNEPRWQIDAETGERVHVGPIEMTFDGRISQGQDEPRKFMWVLLAAGAVILVVTGSLGYVLLRRGADAPVASGSSAAPATAQPVPETEGAAPPPSTGAAAAAPGDSAQGPGMPSTTPVPKEEAPAAVGPVARALPAETPDTAPVTRPPARVAPPAAHKTPPAPEPAEAPAVPPAGEVPGPGADPRFAAALQRLDQGDAAGAARLFEEWIVTGNPGRFSLQLLIACQEETVKAALARAGAGGSLFILPYDLKGRPCYRVCWGVYADAASARAAASAIPQALTGGTVPLVMPLSRLRPSR